MGCSIFTDKDNVGLLCFTNIVIGIISGIGLMFLRRYKHKKDDYESMQRLMTINDEYAGFPAENRTQRNQPPQSNRLLGRNRQSYLRCPESIYVNRRDDYLDPEFHNEDSNYLKPIQSMDENTDLEQEPRGRYMNTCSDKRQCVQTSLDDYLEPRNKCCK